jgi:hypothetical protein
MVLIIFQHYRSKPKKDEYGKNISSLLWISQRKLKGYLLIQHQGSNWQEKKRISRAGDGVLAVANFSKDCFGETPKPTRETRALPEMCAVLAAIAFDNAASV